MSKENKPSKKKIAKIKKALKQAVKDTNRAQKDYDKAVKACKKKNKSLRIDLKNTKRREKELEQTYLQLQKQKSDRNQQEEKAQKKVSKKSRKKKASPKKSKANKNSNGKKLKRMPSESNEATHPEKRTTPPEKPSVKARASHTRAQVPKNVTATKTEKLLQDRKEKPTKAQQANASLSAKKSSKGPAERSNLKIIDGIGPAIERHLHAAGIHSYAQLAKTSAKKIREILTERGGSRYAKYDPQHWPQQASYARDGKMEALKDYKASLKK